MHFSLKSKKICTLWLIALIAIVATVLGDGLFRMQAAHADGGTFIDQFSKQSLVAKTVPGNGDHNPYGVAVIKQSIGNLVEGNILINNFNDRANKKGRGTTIVQVSPNGQLSTFAEIHSWNLPGSCFGGVGLAGGLVILKRGWVIASSIPTRDGTSATAQPGCLIVLNSWGQVVETIVDPLINGPWGLTVADFYDTAALFVSNLLNGTVAASPHVINEGTVVRIWLAVPDQEIGAPIVQQMAVIGSNFPERTDKHKLVYGPKGVAIGNDGVLYVSDSLNNRVAAIPGALFRMDTAYTGDSVTTNGGIFLPEGMVMAPNGNILVVNHNGKMVEVSPYGGGQVVVKDLHEGDYLTGLDVPESGDGVYYVDDCDSTLKLLS